jgi:hypothetical protein
MDGWMNGRMNLIRNEWREGKMDGWKFGQNDRWLSGRMSKRSDGRVDEHIDGRMEREMEGEVGRHIYFFIIFLMSSLSGSSIRII